MNEIVVKEFSGLITTAQIDGVEIQTYSLAKILKYTMVSKSQFTTATIFDIDSWLSVKKELSRDTQYEYVVDPSPITQFIVSPGDTINCQEYMESTNLYQAMVLINSMKSQGKTSTLWVRIDPSVPSLEIQLSDLKVAYRFTQVNIPEFTEEEMVNAYNLYWMKKKDKDFWFQDIESEDPVRFIIE